VQRREDIVNLRFFHHESLVVRIVEIASAGLLLSALVSLFLRPHSPATAVALILTALLYVFLRWCASKRWYDNAPRSAGIELQFCKSMTATAYILTIAGVWFRIAPGVAPYAIAVLLLAVLAHVNAILITLHRRDRDPTPVNAFSAPLVDANVLPVR
jgi:hypothetical protein